jgi:hydroxybutyrate-dimer hydrolase
MYPIRVLKPVALLIPMLLAGCGDEDRSEFTPNARPGWLSAEISRITYDGVGNDLLTGGLGRTGLAAAAPPAFVDANNPTAAELRTRAIHTNYRALIDPTTAGGFGVLYGPNVSAAGVAGTGEGRIAGEEWIAYADDGSGRENVTLMVQIPASFNPTAACIVTATSSGSRGIYGAIGTAGEWGLKNNCAVAYTDKGSGNGGHDLSANTVALQNGVRSDAMSAGRRSQFTAALTDAERAAFNAATPNRWAYKHAHSQLNPEKDWGRDTLRAVEFAFYALNERFGRMLDGVRDTTLTPANTIVIASSVSNGGGAALAAAEQDTAGLIDAVAVAEPQVQVNLPSGVSVRRGATTVAGAGKGLYDYTTIANLYQPCAATDPALATSPGALFVNGTIAGNRCVALVNAGLLQLQGPISPTRQALNKLREAGWEPESDLLHPSHYAFATNPIVITYLNSYGRFSVKDNACGYSFAAAANNSPVALPAASAAQLFAVGNGVPPTGGIAIINNNSVGGPAVDGASRSPSSQVLDYNFDGAQCSRAMFNPASVGLTSAQQATYAAASAAVNAGIAQVKRTANLRGKPAIIVHGRADALVPVNHASRPYTALNKSVEGASSRLSYIEVTNAQHFDAFIGSAALPGYDTRYIPLHVYFNRALDAVYANLRSGAALPPSQVVRTVPRGGTPGAAPAITAANAPNWSAAPGAADSITFASGVLTVPE